MHRTGLDVDMEARFQHFYDASEKLAEIFTAANGTGTSKSK